MVHYKKVADYDNLIATWYLASLQNHPNSKCLNYVVMPLILLIISAGDCFDHFFGLDETGVEIVINILCYLIGMVFGIRGKKRIQEEIRLTIGCQFKFISSLK